MTEKEPGLGLGAGELTGKRVEGDQEWEIEESVKGKGSSSKRAGGVGKGAGKEAGKVCLYDGFITGTVKAAATKYCN